MHCQGDRHHRLRGFSLIELLIVVVIVGVLLLVAIPGYQGQVLKARRGVALSTLSLVRSDQEQFFVNHYRYATDLDVLGYSASPFAVNEYREQVPVDSSERIYEITLEGANSTGFTLVATARRGQREDRRCTRLTLDAIGVRGASPGSVEECW